MFARRLGRGIRLHISTESVPDLRGYDAIVIGAGFAGSVIARELAERASMSVALVESRDHIGGNSYDALDEHGVLVHRYGPHIFHTANERVFSYLSRFTQWRAYEHRVLARLDESTYIPVPFNKTSIEIAFGKERGAELIDKLVEAYGDERKVPIAQLRQTDDPDLAELADFVYENVFRHYSSKQWGTDPSTLDPSITGRVPVFISRDDRYFQDPFQGMPAQGYTRLFESLLDCEGIDLFLGLDARSFLGFAGDGERLLQAVVNGEPYSGIVVFTGSVDELFGFRFGRLPYRSLDFDFETLPMRRFQPCATVNYTVSEDYTRITEFSHLTGQELEVTTIMREYPCAYEGKPGQIPYYVVPGEESARRYGQYAELAASISRFHLLGRLAEYRYYNMDAVVARALELADDLCEQAQLAGKKVLQDG